MIAPASRAGLGSADRRRPVGVPIDQGIPEARVVAPPPGAVRPAEAGQGRVEFTIVPADG